MIFSERKPFVRPEPFVAQKPMVCPMSFEHIACQSTDLGEPQLGYMGGSENGFVFDRLDPTNRGGRFGKTFRFLCVRQVFCGFSV